MGDLAGQWGAIDHVGIAVSDLANALDFYVNVLGLEAPIIEEVADQKVKTAIFPSNGGRIELLEATDVESPIAKFIAKRGEGIHHVALRVDNIEARLAELAKRGIRLIDTTPRVGAGGHLIAFIHPASTGGVLLELCQHQTDKSQEAAV